jgi:hypothetical protein
VNGIDAFTARSAARPSGTFAETVIDYINEKRFLSSKFTPNDFTLTLWDPIAPSGSQKVLEWVKLNYENTTGRMGYADFYKKDFDLKMLDPPGGVVEQWQFKGAWIKGTDFGALDYARAGDDLANITLTIRYDKAILLF